MEGSYVPSRGSGVLPGHPTNDATLADILERVLDKGIVIAGDIQINLLDIELLTIKLRLLIASVDKAREMGINWWESDTSLHSADGREKLEAENRDLRDRLDKLEQRLAVESGEESEETRRGG
jgi:gas vesicle protein GvpA/GvpJ/GvpM family